MNFNSSTALCSINKHSNELPACRLFAQNVFNSRGCVMNIGWLILTRDAVLTMEERSAAVAIAHKKWIDCHHSTAQADPVSGWTLVKDLRVTTQSSLDCPEAVKTQQQTMHYYRSAQKSKKYLLRLRSPFLSELQATRFLHLWWLILLLSMILPCLLDLLTISS